MLSFPRIIWVRRFFGLALCSLAVAHSAAFAQSPSASRADQARQPGTAPVLPASRENRGGEPAAVEIQKVQEHREDREHRDKPLALTAKPRASRLDAAWTPVGPASIANPTYGAVSGRVTALIVDPADVSGNTVYAGSTGGGVWKSVNAAGPSALITFVPLTDSLPVFDLSAGSSVTPSLSIGSLAIGGGVLLAGTGDSNGGSDSYYGGGILRSTDAGLTWSLVTGAADGTNIRRSFVGLSVSSLAFSTTQPLLVVAGLAPAAKGTRLNAGQSASFLKGLYVSEDAGLTWQVATVRDGSQTVESASNAPGDGGGNGVTSVVWNPVRQQFFAALSGHGYYSSSDGKNWSRLSPQPGSGLTLDNCPTLFAGDRHCPIFRGALAVQPVSGDTFALTVDASNGDQGLYQDVCAKAPDGSCTRVVAFGNALNAKPLEQGSGSITIAQGSYNLALAANASGTDTVLYVGTIDLYRCNLAAGCLLRDTTNAENGCATPAGVAGAQHAIALGATPMIFLGNDGGLWRSVDGVAQSDSACSASDATHFDNLNQGLGSLAEVLSFAQDPVDPGTLIAGFGALGSASITSTSTVWSQLSTGEGGNVAIDPLNPQNWYVSTGAGVEIAECTKGPACRVADFLSPAIGPAQVQDSALVHAAWAIDPGLTSELLIGTCRLWRGTAAAWTGADLLSAPFAAALASACGPGFGVVRSLGAGGPVSTGVADPNAGSVVLYAGMAGISAGGGGVGGHLFTTASAQHAGAATAWTDAALAHVTNASGDAGLFNPGGFDISSLAVDAHDATGLTVYATVAGFAGNGVNAPHLYRSSDGGASWLNVSSNLPNEPANSVVVDPNDANTVYIGLDNGVYVTTAITTCTTTSCWSVYGINLPDAPVTELAAAAGMSTGDGRTGELRVATYGRGLWTIPLLTAVFPAQPQLALSLSSLAFPEQPVGTASAAQTITVTNTGNALLIVSSIVATADFVAADTCVGTPLAPLATCSIAISFAPTAVGPRTGVLTVYGNVAGGQAVASLSGFGTAPAAIVLTPVLLDFGSVNVGSVSPGQAVTVSNTGGTATGLQSLAIVGDFSLSANSCGASLAPDTGCTVLITFTPVASGHRRGTLTVTDDAGVQVVQLSGSGANPATDALAPLSLDFAAQQITTASAAMPVTLTNAGDVALLLVTATASGHFLVVNGCGASLAAHSTCTFEVKFVPKSLGVENGSLLVSDEFRTQTVALSGMAIAPPGISLSPSDGLTFAATALGQTAVPQVVTLTNNGGVALVFSSISATGDFAIAENRCGSSIAAGAVCQLSVLFSPTAAGLRAGTISFVDNAATSPQTLTLNGSGIDFEIGADGPATMTVVSGATASYLLLLTSSPGVPGTALFTCSGVPVGAVCTVTPSSAPLYAAGGGVITVTLATGVSQAGLQSPKKSWSAVAGWLALALPAGLLLQRKRRGWRLLLVLGLLGCSTVGRTIPPGGGGGTTSPILTPKGSYTLLVAASSAGLVRVVNLTLVVQ